MQNYNPINNRPALFREGAFYNTWGLAFILIFMMLFQLVFYFFSVYLGSVIYHVDIRDALNLLKEPDGTALAVNLARLTNILVITGSIFLPALLFTLINKKSISAEAGLRNPIKGRAFFIAILILLLAMPLVDFITAWFNSADLPLWLSHYAEYFEHQRTEALNTVLDMERPVELIFCLFAVGLLPALFEEFLFRGILLNLFKNITGKAGLSVFLQATVFTILHFSIYEFPGILMMGIIFGMIANRTGSIKTGIALHFIFNATSIVITWFNQQEFRATGVYGKYGNLALNPLTAFMAFAGILILAGIFRKVTPQASSLHE